jgi:hypothetical protein
VYVDMEREGWTWTRRGKRGHGHGAHLGLSRGAIDEGVVGIEIPMSEAFAVEVRQRRCDSAERSECGEGREGRAIGVGVAGTALEVWWPSELDPLGLGVEQLEHLRGKG